MKRSTLFHLFTVPSLALAAIPSQIQALGRVPASGQLTWPFTGIRFTFTGTQANFSFTGSGTNGLAISIDGSDIAASKHIFTGSGVLGTGKLTNGRHTVEIRKVSESYPGTVTFGNVTTDGSLVATQAKVRTIEFIGDSITTGYGVDGTFPCVDEVATKNAAKTYAAILKKQFDADVSFIARSGRGLMRNHPDSKGQNPDPPMPAMWRRTSASDTTPTYTFPASAVPSAVVVHLGTEDFVYLTGPADSSGNPTPSRPKMTMETYAAAMSSFVQEIRAVYACSKIFLVSSPMLSDAWPVGGKEHLTQLAGLLSAASGMQDVFVVDFKTQGSQVGCHYNPSAATHQQMAATLGAVMKEQMGW